MNPEFIGPKIPSLESVNEDQSDANENDAALLEEYRKTLQNLDEKDKEGKSEEDQESDDDAEEIDLDSDEEMEESEESEGKSHVLDQFSLEDILNYLKELREDTKNEDPSEIVTLYEQALKIDASQVDLWIEFTNYLEKTLKDYNRAISTFDLAMKACPGYIPIVQNALLANEKAGKSIEDIQKIFEDNEENIQTAEDGVSLYTTFIYLARRLGSSNVELDLLFRRGISNLEEYFGKAWDPDTRFRRNYAYFLYTKLKKPDDALEIWRNILKSGFGNKAEPWLELIKLERHFGTVKNARKLLYDAVNSVTDNPNEVFSYFVQFEREEGNRDEVDKALEKINNRFYRLQEQIQKNPRGKKDSKNPLIEKPKKKEPIAKTNSPSKRKLPKNEHDEVPTKKKAEEKHVVDKDGFVVPTMPIRTKSASSSPKPEMPSSPQSIETEEPMESQPSQSVSVGSPDHTIFISNFDYAWTENEVRNLFPEAKEIRMPMKTKFTSKGYAYIDFETKTLVEKYLVKDGQLTSKNRPIHISPYQPHAKGEKAAFKFGLTKEENKLFIRNVHFDATNEDLKKIFEKYGSLKSVRIVTRPTGQPKGFAYVEFEESVAATRALEADGHKLKGRKIKVLISDPSAAKKPQENAESNESQSQPRIPVDRSSIISFKPRSRILLDK